MVALICCSSDFHSYMHMPIISWWPRNGEISGLTLGVYAPQRRNRTALRGYCAK